MTLHGTPYSTVVSPHARWPVVFVALLACGADDAGNAPPNGNEPSAVAATSTASTCLASRTLSAAELSSPVTSFESDVAPMLAKSCAFASCHGSSGKGNHGVFLSAKSSDDMPKVKTALGAKAKALPTMPYVTPGDPENSFLMHKLDGDLCTLDEHCVGRSCGKSMPQGNELLPEAARDSVRRWIAQGAK